MFFTSLLKDARYFQIIFQFTFLSYGIFYLGWKAEWWLYTIYLATSLLTQLLFESARSLTNGNHRPLPAKLKTSLPSAVISALGLCLLLKTNSITVAVLAAFISIASKYILHINAKHIFNPSALAIVVTVFLMQNAWISPGQWGSGTVILFAVCCLGFIITTKVQKLDVSGAFLLSFGGLLFIRQVIFVGWPLDYFIQSISTGSVLLFCFFMISDPKTSPNHPIVRITWSIVVGIISFYLSTFKFINGAPVLVLICSQPIVPLLDKLFKAAPFQWHSTMHSTMHSTKQSVLHNTFNHLFL
jgi:Na+-transporting NADH:ubiquinone oxidoreductase subunit NqrB